ncbi:MAG: SDR family oxidoreductase [Bdellovibrionota bacterium]
MFDKWVIATGLTRGIGFEFAKKMHEEGYKIIHLGRKKIGFEDEHLLWDLLSPIFINPLDELHTILSEKLVYGFVYCAGLMPILEIVDSNKTQNKLFWQSQAEAMRVNYFACAELVEEILPFLLSPPKKQDEKFIPFVAHLSSLAMVDPFPGLELYGVTKSAIFQYFVWLAKRFKPQQLNCLSIHPGTVHTDMIADIIKKERETHPLVELLVKLQDQKQFIMPAESAHKIFDFLFHENELKTNAHGKLFLVDKYEIL